jgi:hypothetical protein
MVKANVIESFTCALNFAHAYGRAVDRLAADVDAWPKPALRGVCGRATGMEPQERSESKGRSNGSVAGRGPTFHPSP